MPRKKVYAYADGAAIGIDNDVMRLQVLRAKEAFRDKRPSIYVIPGVYIGYDRELYVSSRRKAYKKKPTITSKELEDSTQYELRRYSYPEVVEIVAFALGTGTDTSKIKDIKEAFDYRKDSATLPNETKWKTMATEGYKYISPTIDHDTTVIVVPSRWNRKLDASYAPYINQLSYLPFHIPLHHTIDDIKTLKKLIPPAKALELMYNNALIKRLNNDKLLILMSGGSGGGGVTGESGLVWTEDNIPDEVKGISFKSSSRRRKSSKRHKKRKSSKKKKKKHSSIRKRRKSKKKSSNRRKKRSSGKKQRRRRKSRHTSSTGSSRSLTVGTQSLLGTIKLLKKARAHAKNRRP